VSEEHNTHPELAAELRHLADRLDPPLGAAVTPGSDGAVVVRVGEQILILPASHPYAVYAAQQAQVAALN
jgi:hypothetical protein